MSSLSRDELTELRRVRAWRGLASIAWTWAWILGCFALYAWRPGPVTALVGIAIVSGRQLGLAILMHEGAHYLLVPDRAWNDRISQWLCAQPMLVDTGLYRQIHNLHHKHTWTERDPDLGLARPFPVSRRSLRRKVVRDLTGQTGIKRVIGLARVFAGLTPTGRGREGKSWWLLARTFARRQPAFLAAHAALLGYAIALGRVEAYALLWWVPHLTGYSLVLRLRSIAEHAAVSDPTQELTQTRTTLAPWYQRFLVAPHHVNYHLEHHLFQFIPHYNLPRAHRLLAARGALDDAEIERGGYLAVWRRASAAPADGGGNRAETFLYL